MEEIEDIDEMDLFAILGEARPRTPPPPSLSLSTKTDALDEDSPAFPLESLPIDILWLIFQRFCTHCYSEPDGPTDPIAYARICREALRALSVCSKKLSPLALSCLAHRPCSRVPFKTLISAFENNPIAAEVKELQLCLYRETSHEDLLFFNQVAQRLPLTVGKALRLGHVEDENPARNVFAMRLLLALTPHIDALTLQTREPRDWEYYGNDHPQSDEEDDEYDDDSEDEDEEEEEVLDGVLEERRIGPESNNVRHFFSDSLFQEIRVLTLDHSDGGAFCFSNPPLASILAATVNLRHLKIRNALGGNLRDDYASIDFKAKELAPALQHLETIEIEDCTFNDSSETSEFAVLAKIIACAPNLHTFKFRARCHRKALNMMTPTEVLSALLPRRHTLKHIGLDFSSALWKGEKLKAFHLNKFTTIKSLLISECCACECGDCWNFRSHNYCLARAIPPQVEHLSIVFGTFDRSTDHVQYLADQTSIGHFPMLKRATVVYRREFESGDYWRFTKDHRYSLYIHMAAYHEILEKSGIHVNFAGPIFHWLKVERSELSSIEVVDE